MTYDDWKLATPPEYEREESEGPAAGSSEEQRCECGDYPLDEVPSTHDCKSALEPGLYETEEDITW